MDAELKTRFFKNRFVFKLRLRLEVDIDEYEDLCQILREFELAWKDQTLIDKDVVSVMHGSVLVVRNMSEQIGPPYSSRAKQVEKMAGELSGLVSRCFRSKVRLFEEDELPPIT